LSEESNNKIYDTITGKWYEVKRGILGGLKLKYLKDCKDKPSEGTIYVDETGLCTLPDDKKVFYVILEDIK